jgi:hypothetical protein
MGQQIKQRVGEGAVARVLGCIAETPNGRSKPVQGDLAGTFDFWFDGGAGRVQTGNVEYEFSDGTRATVGAPLPVLSIVIEFANGCRVRIQQDPAGPQKT